MAEAPTYQSRRASGAATARETYRLERSAYFSGSEFLACWRVVIVWALAVDKWQRAGLWILTRGDADYPVRLKNRLRTDAPPVLFGCGNKALLQAEGMAIVGSRDAPTEICAIPNNWPRNWPNRGFALSLVVREVLMNVQWPRLWRSGELPLAY